MAKLKVGILFGGKSGEHEVSIVSAMSIFKALDKNKYDVTLVGIDKQGRWLTPPQSELLANAQNPRLINLNKSHEQGVSLLPYPAEKQLIPVAGSRADALAFDVVLPILHGTYGEDGTMQGLLELAQLPYVGSGVLGSAVGMDKEMCKRVMQQAGLPVVPYLTVRKYEFLKSPATIVQEAKRRFGYPYFVKPANMGSSVGVHKVKSDDQAQKLLADAFQYDTKVLIEQAVSARELEVAVLGNHEPKASIVGEIIPNHEFYTYEAKYIDADGADLKIPAEGLSEGQMKEVQRLAVECFKSLECAGMARVDFFLDRDNGQIFINEINTIPGFTSISMYPKLWEATGVPYARLLDRLIELALERHRERSALKTEYTAS